MGEAWSNKPKIALVLGSGGLKCASALGIYEVLLKEDIDIDMIVGSSGGAVVGGSIAVGNSPEQSLHLITNLWDPIVFKQFKLKKIIRILFPWMFKTKGRFGLTDDSKLIQAFEKVYGKDTTFSDTKIPFYCLATDIISGRSIVLNKGRLAEVVRISSGLPLIFEPWEDSGMQLIDGGVANPIPIDVAIRQGADIIIAAGFETPLNPKIDSVKSFISQRFLLLVNKLLHFRIAFYGLATHSEIIIINPDFDEDISLTDVHKIPELIEAGKRETAKHVAYLKRLLQSKKSE